MRAAGQTNQHHHLRMSPFLARCENKNAYSYLTAGGLPVAILNGDFPNTKQCQLLHSVDRPQHVKTFPTNCYFTHTKYSHELQVYSYDRKKKRTPTRITVLQQSMLGA